MMKIYEAKEILHCPYCGNTPDGDDLVAEDYVVPKSRVGTKEDTECGYCYGSFTVEVMDMSRFAAYGDRQ